MRRKKVQYHAALTLERRKTEGPALFRQLVQVMLYAFRGEFIIFDDTVRVQDAVFESGQERLAVVGHRVRVWPALRSALTLESSANSFSFD